MCGHASWCVALCLMPWSLRESHLWSHSCAMNHRTLTSGHRSLQLPQHLLPAVFLAGLVPRVDCLLPNPPLQICFWENKLGLGGVYPDAPGSPMHPTPRPSPCRTAGYACACLCVLDRALGTVCRLQAGRAVELGPFHRFGR